MPPRKSNVSNVSATDLDNSMLTDTGNNDMPDMGKLGRKKKKEDTSGTSGEQAQLGIDEFMMPRMMTVRLAKGVLPLHTLIHRDAATSLQYAASVFLNHIAAAANEHTLAAQRKNISPHDMLLGLKDTEWGALVPQLEEELAIYVRTINDKRNEYRRKLKERGSLGSAAGAGAAAGAADAAGAAEAGDAGIAATGASSEDIMGELGDKMGDEEMKDDEEEEDEDEVDRGDGPPRAKKARLSEGAKSMLSSKQRQGSRMEEDEEGEEEEDEEEEDDEGEDDEDEGEDEEVDDEEDQEGADDDDDDETEGQESDRNEGNEDESGDESE